jgi:hypothetical protein
MRGPPIVFDNENPLVLEDCTYRTLELKSTIPAALSSIIATLPLGEYVTRSPGRKYELALAKVMKLFDPDIPAPVNSIT